MSGIESAIVTAVASNVTQRAIQWLDNQGPEVSEKEWERVGYYIGNELKAIHEQQKTDPTRLTNLQKELAQAGESYQKLAFVGEDFGFDEEITDLYDELASACAEWKVATEVHDSMSTEVDNFEDLRSKHKEMVFDQ